MIERLEGYLNPRENRGDTPPPIDDEDDEDEDDDFRPPTPVERQVEMWEDQCKRMFLWYYEIYLVLPII